MGFSTEPQTWQEAQNYDYPLDTVIDLARQALIAIESSLQASYTNTIKGSISGEQGQMLESMISVALPARIQGFNVFLDLLEKTNEISTKQEVTLEKQG